MSNESDPDSIATLLLSRASTARASSNGERQPLKREPNTVPKGENKLAVLRADVHAAIAQRDAIDDCFSPAWLAAHKEAILACARANDELERLAKNPKTRHGSWRTPADIELMVLGYL